MGSRTKCTNRSCTFWVPIKVSVGNTNLPGWFIQVLQNSDLQINSETRCCLQMKHLLQINLRCDLLNDLHYSNGAVLPAGR